MRRFAILLLPLLLSFMLIVLVPTNVSAVGTHSTTVTGTTPAGTSNGQFIYVNCTVLAGETITYSFGPNNYYYQVWVRYPDGSMDLLKGDIRSTQAGTSGSYTGIATTHTAQNCGGSLNASYTTQTGQYRFFLRDLDGWVYPTPGVPYTITYTSPNSGSDARVMNVINSAPYSYTLADFNDTYHGLLEVGAGSSIDGLQVSYFLPDLAGTVVWRTNVSYYDGTTLLHTYQYPQSSNQSSYYQMTIGLYINAGAGSPDWKDHIDITTASAHIYYLNADFMAYDSSTGEYVNGYHVTITVREAIATPAQVNWIMGIIWMLIMFFPAWILNWVFPRYGLILGLALMSIVLGFTYPNAMWVSFLSFLVLGSMLFTMRSD